MELTSKSRHWLLAGALALAGASDALATPTFIVNPTSIGGAGAVFEADAIHGVSSTRIVHNAGDPANVYHAAGYAVFTSFALNSKPIPGGTSRVNVDYGLYATFTQTFTCSGALGPGVSCLSSAFGFDLWADPGNDNNYLQSTVAADPSIVAAGAQYKLATTSTLNAGIGGLDALGGAFQNLNFGWTLTDSPTDPDGHDYFIGPIPFHTLAFSAFNNTSSGVACNTVNCVDASVIAINAETGVIDLATPVPEPSSLALLGLGFLGLNYGRRRFH